MIVLLDTPEDHATCADELGVECGELLTPLTRRAWRGAQYGIDNGAFSKFNRNGFLSLLERMKPNCDKCLFVAAPDVVGAGRRTLEAFRIWREQLEGWPVALVMQDGVEDLDLPWRDMAAVFIGGSTEFKLSNAAADIIKTAQLLDKWTHVGRINTPERFTRFEELGVDSCDGTGIARYTHMRRAIAGRNDSLFTDAA